jgi:tetratricopeptide repeat protein 30
MQQRAPEGQKTKTIYSLIKAERYQEAIKLLNAEIQFAPKSRALSLLAYCYYMAQDFQSACPIYEQLTYLYPTEDEYKLYYAQSLYRMSEYDSALRSCQGISSPEYQEQLSVLNAYIRYEMGEYNTAKNLSEGVDNEASSMVLKAAILLKEDKYEEALQKFEHSKGIVGNKPELLYNIALCHYKMRQYDKCMQFIAEIIEKGTRDHPDLGVGTNAEGRDITSVGNTQILKESALVEVFNLKAAIEYNLKNSGQAKEALWDMPPRHETEWDPVTLMNYALMNIDNDPTGGFKKLNYLLHNPPFPPETFCNLLLLYCKFHYYDLAADILAENSELTIKYITNDDYEYLEALIFQNSNPDETAKRLEQLGSKHLENLKRITKQIKESKNESDNKGLKNSLKEYDDSLEKYIPVLMAEANIHWNKEDYSAVERLFRNTADYCSVHDTWRLNYAHTYFIQEDKYLECIQWYEKILEKNLSSNSLLELPAIVIANLCVSYIMVNENAKAEDIIKTLEEAEQRALEENPDKPMYHQCIVNLVIGTLYCSKGNYEFGIGRIIKSFDPLNKKLSTDTWYYAKRCLLAMLEKMAKHMVIIPDKIVIEVLDFLESSEKFGKKIRSDMNPIEHQGELMVTDEARIIRRLLIKIRD